MRNGVHHNPDKLKQLEVERLELGVYHLQEVTSFWSFKFISIYYHVYELEHKFEFSQIGLNVGSSV